MDANSLSTIPAAVTLGLLVPSLLAALPIFSLDTQLGLLAAWQFFPIWVALSHLLLRFLVPAVNEPSPKTAARRYSTAYRFGVAVAGAFHLGTVAFLALAGMAGFGAVFVPVMQGRTHPPVTTIAEGALTLLQYDVYYACGAVLLWAGIIAVTSAKAGILVTVAKSLVRVSLLGPAGAAAAVMWERDEKLLFGGRV
jgi:hypothetical protein